MKNCFGVNRPAGGEQGFIGLEALPFEVGLSLICSSSIRFPRLTFEASGRIQGCQIVYFHTNLSIGILEGLGKWKMLVCFMFCHLNIFTATW
jgi:hypothetical protein